jgi:hypothetical protein
LRQVFSAPTFDDFPALLAAKSYEPVPGDAWLALTDIAGSTSEIAGGRYKDVNLAGAAGIAAFVNAFPDLDLPYTFGGDGAAILVPDAHAGRAKEVLQGLARTSANMLGLSLRAGLIPLTVIRQRGAQLALAFHRLKGGVKLAMFSGGGLGLAERLLKEAEGAEYTVQTNAAAPEPDLSGLSCRWRPIRPQRGIMLSIVADCGGPPDAYAPVFDAIAQAAAGPQSPLARPPSMTWPPSRLWTEARLQAPKSPGRYAAVAAVQAGLGVLSTATGLRIGGFDGRHYRASLAAHCDAMKFADGLKMVIDCTPGEATAVETTLRSLAAGGELRFGLQRSSAALMTCFVRTSADAGHVHFIDGAEGGYAVAAMQLKSARPDRDLTND